MGASYQDSSWRSAGAAESDRYGWAPLDFLLRSEFCPPAAIPPVLEELRQDLDADAALLLAAGSRGLLRTLCFCASKDERGDLLESFLRSSKVSKVRRRRDLARRSGSGMTVLADDPKWRATRVLGRIARVAAKDARPDVVAAIGDPEEWLAVRAPDEMQRMPMTVAAFVRRPNPARVSASEIPFVESNDAMLRLAVMASATASTSVYRDTMTTLRVDEKLDPDRLGDISGDLSAQTRSMVELAAEVTDSTDAAYYLLDPVEAVLRLVATHPPASDRGSFPETVAVESDFAAGVAAKRRRPVAHGSGGSTAYRATLQTDRVNEDRYVEIATPVPGHIASNRPSCTGVLTVLRLTKSRRELASYAAYHHALLRNVALRIALLHATEDMEAAAEMFRDLTIRRTETALRPRERQADEVVQQLHSHPIPEDVNRALPAIEDSLAKVARLTGSHSATFRVALPDIETAAPHGLSLVRVAAHSKEGMLDPQVVQDMDGGGVNVQAALTGSVQNVPFVGQNKSYEPVREGTLSEISVPVKVEGMLIGVVNLESRVGRNYDARVSTAIAFAEHVGMVLADARLASARQLHQFATQIVTRAHDLSAETTQITQATATSPPMVKHKVNEALEQIEERARGIGKFDLEEGRRGPMTMPAIAAAAVEKAEIAAIDADFEAEIEGEAWNPFGEITTGVVYDCLRHVFVNVQNHMPIKAEGPAQVRMARGVLWGGRRYDVLRVRNEAKRRIDPVRAINLYRVPIVDRKRQRRSSGGEEVDLPRFGAYLAGNQARAIGGNVHLALESPKRVRLTVMVPEPSRVDPDA